MTVRGRIRSGDVRLPGGRSLALARLRSDRADARTVLFVPGAFCGDWIWRDNFMRSLHARGFDVFAMSPGGRGLRGGRLHLRGLRDLVRDLEAVVDRFPAPPRIVAHSLGGRLALEIAQRRSLPAVALLAPLPLDGGWRSVLSLARRSWPSVAKLLAVAVEPRVALLGSPPVGMFGPEVPAARQRSFARRLEAESLRALVEAMLPSPHRGAPRAPLRFFAGGQDQIVPAGEVARFAASLGAPVTTYPAMGHTFQYESQHDQVCEDVAAWFDELDAARLAAPGPSGGSRAPAPRPR